MWNESLAEVAGCLEKRELRTKENEEVGKEGELRKGDVATCAVVANGCMHTYRRCTCQSNRCGSNRYQYERFSAQQMPCARGSLKCWVELKMPLPARRMLGPAREQDDMARRLSNTHLGTQTTHLTKQQSRSVNI